MLKILSLTTPPLSIDTKKSPPMKAPNTPTSMFYSSSMFYTRSVRPPLFIITLAAQPIAAPTAHQI